MNSYMLNKKNTIEKILWSIAFPGFGQILNGKLVKGLIFLFFELLINIKANINEVIILSFHGNTLKAIERTNYQWLMFYPCIYMFAIWDAYRDSGGHNTPNAFLPFVLSAFLGTIGVVYSSVFRIKGILLGPVWFPVVCFIFGVLIGVVIQRFLIVMHKEKMLS